jgi:antitoxin CcdA
MRTKVNLTLDREVAAEARALGLNMSRLAEEAISRAARVERNRRWQEENRAAIVAYNAFIDRHGVPFSEYRKF